VSAAAGNRFPLQAAATTTAKVWTAVGGVVTGLASVGIITADQNAALQGLFAGVAALVAAGTSALAAFGVRKRAEPLVTPVADPRDDTGAVLAPVAVSRATPNVPKSTPGEQQEGKEQ